MTNGIHHGDRDRPGADRATAPAAGSAAATDPIVIIGSGLAGYTLAREFRRLDRDAPLLVLTRDDGQFYSKPMLSNALAANRSADEIATASAADMAAQLGAEVRPRTSVEVIDIAERRLRTSAGVQRWRSLVLAMGADPIALPLAGDAAGAVLRVNDLGDYARFREALAAAARRRVVLLGAGLIGSEFANDLAGAGYRVEVVDPAPQPLGRLLPAVAAERVRDALAALGVQWHFGVTAQAVERARDGLRVTLSDGTTLDADVVLSAVGLRPRVALARDAGLAVARGIVVDRHLRSSADGVFALGDCAEVEGRVLPYVLPLMAAARALAKTLAGTPTAVDWPAMPVAVKTPAMPVVVAPPGTGAGEWSIDADAAGMTARFLDTGGALAGFALLGAATAQRTALARQLPPVLA